MPTPPNRRAKPRLDRQAAPAYVCVTCGERFARYGAAAERHVDEHGGGRLDAVVETRTNQPTNQEHP